MVSCCHLVASTRWGTPVSSSCCPSHLLPSPCAAWCPSMARSSSEGKTPSWTTSCDARPRAPGPRRRLYLVCVLHGHRAWSPAKGGHSRVEIPFVFAATAIFWSLHSSQAGVLPAASLTLRVESDLQGNRNTSFSQVPPK